MREEMQILQSASRSSKGVGGEKVKRPEVRVPVMSTSKRAPGKKFDIHKGGLAVPSTSPGKGSDD